MALIYIALIAIGVLACVGWYKLCMWSFWPKKKEVIEANPYIRSHELKMLNDNMYDEYIDWLAKHGHGVPIPKIKSPEDIEAEKKIKRLI